MGLVGIIDSFTKKISLITTDEVGSVLATVVVSHGAAISPDPSKQAINYDQKFHCNCNTKMEKPKLLIQLKKRFLKN